MSVPIDVGVVGAGPAGAAAALRLARLGRRVVLVDRARFPRDKVCGGCLSPLAQRELAALGIEAPGVPVRTLVLCARGRRGRAPVALRALSRRALDQLLVERAVAAGAGFRDGVREPPPAVRTVWAAGLGGGRARPCYFGVGGVVPDAPWPEGELWMVRGAAGYVGLVRAENDRGLVAAAVRPTRDPRAAVEDLLGEAGLDLPDGTELGATPLFPRRAARLWDEGGRRLRIGDAAGYAEPFTGEGIGWALRAARLVAPLAAADPAANPGPAWARTWRREIAPQQRRCRWLGAALRSESIAVLVSRFPALARPFLPS